VKKSSARISALVAVSSGLAALPAAALELGDVQVNSSLGQPLRASIAYALAPNEDLIGSCVSLQAGTPQNRMPIVDSARITVADGVISIMGVTALRDPLVSMRINVRCPYTANLSREYMLFIDPAPISSAIPTRVEDPAARVAQPAPVAATRRVAARTPIAAPLASGTRHRVQPGESLSEIAQAIADRPVGLWAAVGAIFAANPDAFIDNDPNKLKAGSWLDIPDFGAAGADVFSTATANVAPEVTANPEPVSSEPVSSEPVSSAAVSSAAVSFEAAGSEPASVDPASNSDNPYVGASDFVAPTVIDIPDTELEGPRVTSSSPNVAAASIRPAAVEAPSTNWWLWLIGAGFALLGTLLLFGRLLRERFASSPIGAIAVPERRRSESDTQRIEAISAIEVEFQELSETQENALLQESSALDADLIIGTGLQRGSEIDVAQDFGFSTATALDLELPEEMSSGGSYASSTDIIPPINFELQSILDSEVLPQVMSSDDDYDMSVVVDATKMPLPEDFTQRDLEAVQLETGDDTLITGDYTVSHEVDYKVLEQDYEDEFTATQALNNEITRAAAELAARMDEELGAMENTAEMSLASITALDITAQLPANNDDDISDLDDTGINEAVTVDMHLDDNTAEMPVKKGKSA